MRRHAFTLIELLVVISIIALLIAILLPVLSDAKRQARIMQNATHQRGLHQSFVIYADSNDGYYPGLDSSRANGLIPATRDGKPTNSARKSGEWPAARFALLIDNDIVSPEYVINPADPSPREAWTYGKTGLDSFGTAFDWHNFSYAVEEWSGGTTGYNQYKVDQARLDKMGSQTPAIADRIIVIVDQEFNNLNAYIGVFSKKPGNFEMGLAWGDGHTTFQNTPVVDTRYGKYRNTNDNIYMRLDDDSSVVSTPAPEPFPSPTGDMSVHAKFAYFNPVRHQSHSSEWPAGSGRPID